MRVDVVCLQICLNFDCNLLMLSGTSLCVSNSRTQPGSLRLASWTAQALVSKKHTFLQVEGKGSRLRANEVAGAQRGRGRGKGVHAQESRRSQHL